MALGRAAFLGGEDEVPFCGRCDICSRGEDGSLDGYGGGLVAVEERSVDFNGRNASAGYAEADDDPVCGIGVVPAGFPAVEPGASGDVVALFLDRGGGGEEVAGGGEELVGEGVDGAVEGGGNEVFGEC